MTDKLIGTKLGQYHLIELIRRGGMSSVYKARQSSLFDRIVAVKVVENPDFAARFRLEGLASAQLHHPNILPIFDSGEQDGLSYLVLRYIENGTTLSDVMDQPMAPLEAARLIVRILDALDYAHQRGIIHRDIKPGNVLLPSMEMPLLADFGIARLLNDTGPRQTMMGFVMGTAAYMAPEQAEGRDVDARTDIYATGIMLYEMLAGKVPFDADTPQAVWHQHRYQRPQPLSQIVPGISASVETVVLRALEKEPAKRYQTAADMKAALDRVVVQLQESDKHERITGLYERGIQAFQEGRLDQAIDYLGKLVELDPDHSEGTDMLADAISQREELRQRISKIQERYSTTQRKAESPQAFEREPATGPTSLERIDVTERLTPVTHETTRFPPEDEVPSVAPVTTNSERVAAPITHESPVVSPDETPVAVDVIQPSSTQIVTTPDVAPPHKKMRWWPIGVGVAVLALALAAFFLTRPSAGIGAGTTPQPAVTPPPVEPTPGAATATSSAPTAEPTVAPTAPATSEPPPAPQGSLVFEDEFLDGGVQSGLEDLINDPVFQRGFHADNGGVYHLRLLENSNTRIVLLPRNLYGDFTIEMEMWDFSDDTRRGTVGQGIVFRARDANHNYAFLVDSRTGEYSIEKRAGPGQESQIVGWTPSSLIKRNQEHNLVRIDGTGSNFTIYLNGAQVQTFTDADYASGMLGMIVANQDAIEPHMHFDKLKIWSTDSLAVSDAPPTRETETGEMALIIGGEFIVGANEDSDDSQPNVVELPDFYIDRTEVTNAMYARCVEAGACTPQESVSSETHPSYATDAAFADFPAIYVSWQQANTFCGWAKKRLPSEAEWEKAASWDNGTQVKTNWPWGNTFDRKLGNTNSPSTRDTTAVGSFPAAANTLFDMAGNVSEWTNSLSRPYPYRADDGREDTNSNEARVYRGGSWGQSEGKARSSFRQSSTPERGDREIGFRCAMTPTP